MNQNNDTPPARFFLTKISLPVHRLMTAMAVECAGQVAALLSFDKKATFGLKLAVDEAFCNAVEHFSGPVDEDEQVRIEFFVEGDALIVSIRERGIPFDLSQAERFTPDTPEGMNKPGLGTLLMHQGMDSVEMFIHGREGKEVRLTKKLTFGCLPLGLLETKTVKAGRKRISVPEPLIRLAGIDDLPKICRLAWRCYGFTQEATLYALDELTKKTESGEYKSMVAFDPASGNMIGHSALKYQPLGVNTPELGLAFVDPAYRSPGLPKKIAEALFDLARNRGDRGIFSYSLTTHTFSQKALHEVDSLPCGLLLGIASQDMQIKELDTSRQVKGSTVTHFHVLDRSPDTIFVPDRHREIVKEIYRQFGLPRNFGTPAVEPATGLSSVSTALLSKETNVAFVTVHSIGADTAGEMAESLRQCRREHRDAVYAFLPLGNAGTPLLAEECERLGFFFAGIIPRIHDGQDRLLMQYVDIPLNTDAIRVYGDLSRKLLSYILSEQERIRKLR
ncbi:MULTISPECIES: GNAT family N-acetyltransferase [unclassified Pseudodesulfovibrio]|uniref:GNAT family N-acetyltransferase n=1 Tax=unclassified Pseudodesulfovibrio TaxID=2661612 RepID=UPI0013E3C49B|nr:MULTISPECIES: GNAT family N-acetyltransferase [unclassified Pseudodesulfovibrio]MCJ2165128.1 ATP-binding protein [Pseudodesulfovibrio sp. S3-i]